MKTKTIILALMLVLLLVVVGVAMAQVDLTAPRWVLGGGASESTASGLSLRATLGQPVVGAVTNNGGNIVLRQGFWHAGSYLESEYNVNLPIIRR